MRSKNSSAEPSLPVGHNVMAENKRFLILSLEHEQYAIPITRLLEITVARNIQNDPSLDDFFEGKFEYRGSPIPVLNIKKLFKLPSSPLETLLVVKNKKRTFGILVDAVTDILDSVQNVIPMPKGVVAPGLHCYNGVLRHGDNLVLLLNEDGLLP